jgi:flagellar capping protein FliD
MGVSNSFGANLQQSLLTLTDPTNGILNADLAQNTATQQSLSSQITDFQDRLASQKQLLTQQFNQVNAALEEYPYLLQAVNAELNYTSGLWNGSTTTNSSSSSSTSGS